MPIITSMAVIAGRLVKNPHNSGAHLLSYAATLKSLNRSGSSSGWFASDARATEPLAAAEKGGRCPLRSTHGRCSWTYMRFVRASLCSPVGAFASQSFLDCGVRFELLQRLLSTITGKIHATPTLLKRKHTLDSNSLPRYAPLGAGKGRSRMRAVL